VSDVDVAILGAGPYGLAAAAHLRRAGVDVRVLGDPMSFWRGMPKGMVLRSSWTATCIAEPAGPLSLDSYRDAAGTRIDRPVPLDRFIEYGTWVQQQVAQDVDRRLVQTLDSGPGGFRLLLADGVTLSARRVIVAAGIKPFANRPAYAEGLPPEVASHAGDHDDLSRFSGMRVLVVGGGQSALESAALLHEGGAEAEVVVREDHLNWLHGGKYQRKLGRLGPLLYAPTDVGPMGLSRLVAVPDLFRRLPRGVQDPLAYRSIRPAGAAWLPPRLREVTISLATTVASVTTTSEGLQVGFANGGQRTVDHLLLGTGYRVDIARYRFLAPSLLERVRRVNGYPLLGRGMESSVPGLHFVGAPAAWSFGPTMRFVSGGWYTGRALAQAGAAFRNSGRLGGQPAKMAATTDAQ
jgi:NADPH-dependent 2,4-dienoyl-CoA reductase/sulfur reductase-like enzyme